MLKIVIMFLFLSCYGMDNDKVTRTLALAKIDAVSAIFVKDCEDMHQPLPYTLIVIKKHYLSIYESKKNYWGYLPRTPPEESGK
jgi:hypothetical protein